MSNFILLVIYFLLYFAFAIIYISLKTNLRDNVEIFLSRRRITTFGNISTTFKAIPVLLALFFAYLLKSDRSTLYFGKIIALLFCVFGDFFIDRSFIEGMLMFAIAHIFLIFSFAYGISVHLANFTIEDFIVLAIITLLIIVYDYVFLRYLSLLKIPEKYVTSIYIYTFLISLMLASSIWLTYIDTINQVIVLPFGALMFVVSDSLIAVREFREREMSYSEIKIMGTYFLAIFLISLTPMFV